MMLKEFSKEIGIIVSYLWLLFGAYFFEWKSYSIFLSFLLEFVILCLLYFIVRSIDQLRNPAKYRKFNSSITIVIAVIPLIAVQYLFISLVTGILDPEFDLFRLSNLWELKEISFGFLIILLAYLIRLTQYESLEKMESELQSNFFLQSLILNFSNIIAVGIVVFANVNSLPIVLILMVIFRISMEIFFFKRSKIA